MLEPWLTRPFRADSLSWVMGALIVFVAGNVLAYSRRYLAGDGNSRRHFRDVVLLAASLVAMSFADHLLVLLVAWIVGNLLLIRLMIHGGRWRAARASGMLALRSFAAGFVSLAAGFVLLGIGAGTASASGIVAASAGGSTTTIAGLWLVALTALTQSAAWPFHRWLTSSLNSPTPVSALMHAGIVNGGGFLLARFAPLFLAQPTLLHTVFVVGMVTAVVGTFWKLLQPDLKRMLACSTMGQMGFMLMQCGMGLFGPAVSHLCWHGLFKAYLFLNSGSAVREKREDATVSAGSPAGLLLAGTGGVLGALAFAASSGLGIDLASTTCVMAGLAFIAAAQVSARLASGPLTAWKLIGSPIAGLIGGGLYGLSVRLVETALPALRMASPPPLDALYVAGFAVIILIWAAIQGGLAVRMQSMPAWKRLYVAALNGSQPDPRTITATRGAYQA